MGSKKVRLGLLGLFLLAVGVGGLSVSYLVEAAPLQQVFSRLPVVAQKAIFQVGTLLSQARLGQLKKEKASADKVTDEVARVFGVAGAEAVRLEGGIIAAGVIEARYFKATSKEEPPLQVNSKQLVENLNAQYLSGYSAEDFVLEEEQEETLEDYLKIDEKASDSDKLDGYDASYFLDASHLSSGTIPSARLSLSDSDIPDDITCSNYLPLSGGTVSGSLTAVGGLTIGSSSLYLSENSATTSGTLTIASGNNQNLILDSASGSLVLGAGTNTITNTDANTALLLAPTGPIYFFSSNYQLTSSGTLKVGGITATSLNLGSGNLTTTGTGSFGTLSVSGEINGLTVSSGVITSGTWQGSEIGDEYVANDLTISGGTIENTPIGATTPAAATFTSLTVNNSVSLPADSITDAMVVDTITAANYLPLSGGTLSGDLSLGGNNLTNVGYLQLTGATSAPTATAGRLYFNSADGNLYLYDGSSWVDVTVQGQTYSAGSGLTLANNVFSLDTSYTDNRYLKLSGGSLAGNLNVDAGVLFVDTTNDRVGIGTTSPTNKLEVVGTDVLFYNNSGDVHLKLSKATASNQASLFLQTNFSTRAEIGIIGDDKLRIKTSPDGATFLENIVIDPSTANITLAPTSGNVGIGTTSPSYTLDLNGDLRVKGNDIWGTGNLVLHGAGGGYVEAKSNSADYGLIVRDYDSSNWIDIDANNMELRNNTGNFTIVPAGDLYLSPGGGQTFATDLRASIFYDRDNTAYYLNPAGTSYLNTVSTPKGYVVASKQGVRRIEVASVSHTGSDGVAYTLSISWANAFSGIYQVQAILRGPTLNWNDDPWWYLLSFSTTGASVRYGNQNNQTFTCYFLGIGY